MSELKKQEGGAGANKRDQSKEMPKWLIYGLLAKGILVTLVVIGVLWWSGVF